MTIEELRAEWVAAETERYQYLGSISITQLKINYFSKRYMDKLLAVAEAAEKATDTALPLSELKCAVEKLLGDENENK